MPMPAVTEPPARARKAGRQAGSQPSHVQRAAHSASRRWRAACVIAADVKASHDSVLRWAKAMRILITCRSKRVKNARLNPADARAACSPAPTL